MDFPIKKEETVSKDTSKEARIREEYERKRRKDLSLASQLKIEIDRKKLQNIKKETELIRFRVDNIYNTLQKTLLKKGFKEKIPFIRIMSRPYLKQDIWSSPDSIFITKRIIQITSDQKLLILILNEIGNVFFSKNIFNNKDFQYLNKFLKQNRKHFKENLVGFNFIIPSNQVGISLPYVNIADFQKFVVQLFSFYIRNMFPKKTNKELLDNYLKSIKETFTS